MKVRILESNKIHELERAVNKFLNENISDDTHFISGQLTHRSARYDEHHIDEYHTMTIFYK
jgi:hypothetical protein